MFSYFAFFFLSFFVHLPASVNLAADSCENFRTWGQRIKSVLTSLFMHGSVLMIYFSIENRLCIELISSGGGKSISGRVRQLILAGFYAG